MFDVPLNSDPISISLLYGIIRQNLTALETSAGSLANVVRSICRYLC